MEGQTWDIVTTDDFYSAFIQDYEEFKKEPMSVRKALHCILTGWHLSDWIYKQYYKGENKGDYRQRMFNNCPELKVFHDIANRFKHFELERPKSNITDSNIHHGSHSRGFSFGHDVSCLKITYDERTICIDVLIERVANFWKEVLTERRRCDIL